MVAGDSPKATSGTSIDAGSGTIPGSIITRMSPSRTNATVDATRLTDGASPSLAYPSKRIWTSANEAPGLSSLVVMFYNSFALAFFLLHLSQQYPLLHYIPLGCQASEPLLLRSGMLVVMYGGMRWGRN